MRVRPGGQRTYSQVGSWAGISCLRGHVPQGKSDILRGRQPWKHELKGRWTSFPAYYGWWQPPVASYSKEKRKYSAAFKPVIQSLVCPKTVCFQRLWDQLLRRHESPSQAVWWRWHVHTHRMLGPANHRRMCTAAGRVEMVDAIPAHPMDGVQ